MFIWETKFYFNLGRKKYEKASKLLEEYLAKRGETVKYFEYCFNYYYEINNTKQAFVYLRKCILKKKINKKWENWAVNFFVRKNISEHQYQLAARNAMELANLQNLSDENRKLLLKMLEYIKTKL